MKALIDERPEFRNELINMHVEDVLMGRWCMEFEEPFIANPDSDWDQIEQQAFQYAEVKRIEFYKQSITVQCAVCDF